MFRVPPILLAVLAVQLSHSFAPQSVAQSSNGRPLYVLADQYRVAVDQFKQTIKQVRGIERADERLVNRLDDAAGRMRLAARNPRHFNRLFHDWRNVQRLHAEVETKVFGKYTPNHDLVQAWNLVAYNYILFSEEYFYKIENPGHRNSVRRIPDNSARRDRYLQDPTVSPLSLPRLPSGALIVPPSQ